MACIDEYRFVYKDIKLFMPIDEMKFYNFKPVCSVDSAMSYPNHLNNSLTSLNLPSLLYHRRRMHGQDPYLWNKLPDTNKETQSLDTFKSRIFYIKY